MSALLDTLYDIMSYMGIEFPINTPIYECVGKIKARYMEVRAETGDNGNLTTRIIVNWLEECVENHGFLPGNFDSTLPDDVRESFLRDYVDDDANNISERLLWLLINEMKESDWAAIGAKIDKLRHEIKEGNDGELTVFHVWDDTFSFYMEDEDGRLEYDSIKEAREEIHEWFAQQSDTLIFEIRDSNENTVETIERPDEDSDDDNNSAINSALRNAGF